MLIIVDWEHDDQRNQQLGAFSCKFPGNTEYHTHSILYLLQELNHIHFLFLISFAPLHAAPLHAKHMEKGTIPGLVVTW